MSREGPPVGYTVEHASSRVGSYWDRIELTAEQLVRYSDYGTRVTVPRHGRFIAFGSVSRALGDNNRAPDNPQLFATTDFAKPEPNLIWKPGMELRDDEKEILLETYYRPYHRKILEGIREFDREALLVAWHNTDDRPGYMIGKNDAGEDQEMKAVILSNGGLEHRADSVNGLTTCLPEVLIGFADNVIMSLRKYGLPNEVYLNVGYKGGYTVQNYNTFRNKVLGIDHILHAVQVEYGTGLTHDDWDPYRPNRERMWRLKRAFTEAIHETCKSFGTADNF